MSKVLSTKYYKKKKNAFKKYCGERSKNLPEDEK